VSSRGLAQWRLEQLDYVVQNSHSKSTDVVNLQRYTLYFATLHEEDENLTGMMSRSVEGGGEEGGDAYHAISELQAEVKEMKEIMRSFSLQRSTSGIVMTNTSSGKKKQ
jgi:hypothetical protein